MKLHLFRHGQTNWNEERRVQGQSDSRLTKLGIQQAIDLGESIRHLKFDKIFCSSSLRTRQTAEHVFSHSEQDIVYLDSLREIHLGPWEGHLYADIAIRDPESYQHFWQEPHLFDVAGAESFYDLQNRAVAAVRSIASEFDGQQVAIISHGALIKSFLCHIEDRPLEELWAPPRMHNCSHSIVAFVTDAAGGDADSRILQLAGEAAQE